MRPPVEGPHLCARAFLVPDRSDAEPQARCRHSHQHHARSSRPPRQHGKLCRGEGAHLRQAERRRYGDLRRRRRLVRGDRRRHPYRRDAAACVGSRAISTDGISAPDGVLRDTRNGKEMARIDLTPMPALEGSAQLAECLHGLWRGPGAGLERARNRAGIQELSRALLTACRRSAASMALPSSTTRRPPTPMRRKRRCLPSSTIYWIAGGIAKAGGIEPLKPLFPRVVKAYLIGQAADEFAKTLDGKTAIERCGTLDRAVEAAARDAIADRQEGGGGAAVARLRVLRSLSEFRSARRCLRRRRWRGFPAPS